MGKIARLKEIPLYLHCNPTHQRNHAYRAMPIQSTI